MGHYPLYALSQPIIDALQGCVPPFFSPEQEKFERDLARTASFGFFLGRPLGRGTGDTDGEGPSSEKRLGETDRQITAIRHLGIRNQGVLRRERRG